MLLTNCSSFESTWGHYLSLWTSSSNYEMFKSENTNETIIIKNWCVRTNYKLTYLPKRFEKSEWRSGHLVYQQNEILSWKITSIKLIILFYM